MLPINIIGHNPIFLCHPFQLPFSALSGPNGGLSSAKPLQRSVGVVGKLHAGKSMTANTVPNVSAPTSTIVKSPGFSGGCNQEPSGAAFIACQGRAYLTRFRKRGAELRSMRYERVPDGKTHHNAHQGLLHRAGLPAFSGWQGKLKTRTSPPPFSPRLPISMRSWTIYRRPM